MSAFETVTNRSLKPLCAPIPFFFRKKRGKDISQDVAQTNTSPSH